MIEDMTIRKFAPKTQHDYLQRVKNFAALLGRSPDTASFEDVRRYQLHLAAGGAGVPTLNQSVSTLRFFFRITLGRADILNHTQFVHEPRKLPVVLSPEEVARFLDAAPGLKYKAALSVAYGAGLRVSEVVALKVSDIDSKRMVIRIEQGKGNKDRYVMLSPHLVRQFDCGSRTARRFLDAQRWRPEPRLASLTKNSMAVRIGCCHQSPRSLTSHRASMLAVRHPPGWPLSGKLSRGFAYELLLMLECPRPNAGMSGAQRPTPKALPSRAVASSASSPPRDSRG
jgi:site-specific recombinase XerD